MRVDIEGRLHNLPVPNKTSRTGTSHAIVWNHTSQVFFVRMLVFFDLGMADGWNTTLERLESSFNLSHVLLPQGR